MSKRKERKSAAPPASYLVAAVIAAIAGFATIYLSFAPSDNAITASGGGSPGEGVGSGAASDSPLAGLNNGEMAAFLVWPEPKEIAAFSFEGEGGTIKSLKDWRGKVVLLNLWATWCVPCREEMPALDKLQEVLGGDDFEVVAINIDKGGPEKARDFLKEIGVKGLALYTDPSGKLFNTVKAVGMPTTLLIDREGREIGRLVGPAEWASPEAKLLVEAAIAMKKPGAS